MLIGKGNPDDCCWQKADNAGFGSNKFSVSKWRLIFEPEISSFSRFFWPHSQIFSHAQAAWPLEHSVHLCYCAELFSSDQNKQSSISERQVNLWKKINYIFLTGNTALRALCSFCNYKHKIRIYCCSVSIFISWSDSCQDQFYVYFFMADEHCAERKEESRKCWCC